MVRGEVPRGHRPQVALAGPEEPGIGAPALWHPLAVTSPPACHHYLATMLILRTVTMPVLPSPCYQTGVLHPDEGTPPPPPPPPGALAIVSNNTIKTALLLCKHERDGRMGSYEGLERQTSSITHAKWQGLRSPDGLAALSLDPHKQTQKNNNAGTVTSFSETQKNLDTFLVPLFTLCLWTGKRN